MTNDILKDRQNTHGDFLEVAYLAQQIKRSMHNSRLYYAIDSTKRESLEMIATKIARVICGNAAEKDHWVDIAGYANLIVREIENDTN